MEAKQLGELESQIMELIWKTGPSSVNDILVKLRKHRSIAYTTVATILQRLCEKGLLRKKSEKTFYIFEPLLSKEEYSGNLVKTFMKSVLKSFGDVAIASFADGVDTLPEKEKKRLLKLLQKNEHI